MTDISYDPAGGPSPPVEPTPTMDEVAAAVEEQTRRVHGEPSTPPEPGTRRPRKQVPSDIKGQELIDCPEHCGAVQRRKNMRTHLMSVHHWQRLAANQYAREAHKSRHTTLQRRQPDTRQRGKSSASAAVVHKPRQQMPPPPRVNFTAINPSDIAIGVVQSQVNGHIPSHLLPDVINYVDHTRDIVAALRASRG